VGDLSQHSREESQGRFVVVTSNPFLLGGELVTVIFQRKPNLMLRVWVKDEAVKSVFDFRRPPEERAILLDHVAEFLSSPEFGL
jgi:hypothetical protein